MCVHNYKHAQNVKHFSGKQNSTYLYCRALSMYSCCSIPWESVAETSIMFLERKQGTEKTAAVRDVTLPWSIMKRKKWLNDITVWLMGVAGLWGGVTYCAVFVKMDVRRACSSVRAEGTLEAPQSVPCNGLLSGFGLGISCLRSSASDKKRQNRHLSYNHIFTTEQPWAMKIKPGNTSLHRSS